MRKVESLQKQNELQMLLCMIDFSSKLFKNKKFKSEISSKYYSFLKIKNELRLQVRIEGKRILLIKRLLHQQKVLQPVYDYIKKELKN